MHLRLKTILFAAVLAAIGFPAAAGTVITANLPPGTAIVNIDARADGALHYDSDQAFWSSPFNASGTPVVYPVTAGTYTFRIIDPQDAAQLFPALTSAQTNQIYTGWTFNTPWLEDYLVFDSAATNNGSLVQLFDGAYTNILDQGPWYSDAAGAYNSVLQNGSYNKIRVAGRDSTIFTRSYTFTSDTNIVFVIPDYDGGDNAGGVSVVVTRVEGLKVNWSKVAGGGGTSSDGALTIQGTAGQPDAGVMSDGTLSVAGGFWVSAIQTAGLPTVFVRRLSPASVQVYWLGAANYVVQTNSILGSANWAAYGGSITTLNGTNSITVTPTGNLFFRLKSQ